MAYTIKLRHVGRRGLPGVSGVGGAVDSVNGQTGVVVLDKTDLGLSNVDNLQQLPLSYLDIDVLLTANSDIKVPSQRAIRAYADTQLATKVTVAGDIGGTPSNPQVTATHLSSALPISQGGTGQGSIAAAFDSLSPTTVLGDMIYHDGSDNVRLAGNTTVTKKFLSQTGGGVISTAPSWATIAALDVPTLNQDTTGTASNVTGVVAVANGGTGANNAGSARTNLGVVIGSDVQSFDSDLSAIAALAPSNNDLIQRKLGVWTNRTPAELKVDLALIKTDVGLGNVPNVDATARANHTGTQLASTVSDFDTQVRTSRLDQMVAPNGSVDMNSQRLTGLGSPVSDQDAATKLYVDAIAQGLAVKTAVKYATAVALPTNNYSSGVITASSNGALSVDGQAVLVNDRVLVKNESTQANNGIYSVTATGDGSNPFVLTRVADMDTDSEVPGAFAFVQAGDTNASNGFVVTGAGPFTIGTTAISFTQFSAAGSLIAGAGLTQAGNTFNVIAGSSKITVSADSLDVSESNLTLDNIGGTLAITKGGTGSTSASAARTALGLVIGVDVQPSDSDLTAIAAITPTNDDIIQRKSGAWTNRTMAQLKTDLVLAKADVGLGNVDNTSDVNKPISTATQTALDLKASLVSPALTGVPTAPTAAAGTNTTQIATTAFVEGEIVSGATGIAGIYYVTTTGSDSNNGETWGSAFATIAKAFEEINGGATPTNNRGTVYLGDGTFTLPATVTITRLQALIGMGGNRTIIENAVNGAGILYTGVSPEVSPYSSTNYPNTGLRGFTIRPSGTAGTDTAGIKVQDIVFGQIADVFANGFTGVQGVGIWVFNKELPNGANPGGFVERLQLKQVATDNNTYGILLDRLIAGQPNGITDYRTDQVGYLGYGNNSTNADNSVMYHTWIGVSVNARAVASGANAQTGIMIQKGVQFYHGDISVQFNITGVNGSNTVAPTAIRLQNSSALNSGKTIIRGEASGTGATSISIDDTSTFDAFGLIDFLYSANFPALIIGAGHNGNFKFTGGANGYGLTHNTTQASKPIHSMIEKVTLAGALNTPPPNGPALRTTTGQIDPTHPAFDWLRIKNQWYGLNSFDGTTTLTYLAALQDATRPVLQVPQGLRIMSGANLYSGSGAPNITGSVAGDYYLRTDTPTNSAQQLYVATASNTWSAMGTITVGTPLTIAQGGTGQATASAGFNALSPMTTAGDIIYGGASGAGSRLGAGTTSQLLTGGTTPSWGAVSLTSMVSGTLPIANGGTGQASLTSLPLTAPQITTGLSDSSGNLMVAFTPTGSATRLAIQNAASGGNVAFGVNSSDANAGITFKSKGNGTLVFRPETDTIIASQWRKADNTTVVMDIDTTNGRLGIGTAAPTRTLDVVGVARIQTLIGSSTSVPTPTAGTGAGTAPGTPIITGSDMAGTIAITTGGACPGAATVVTVNFGTSFPNAPYITLTPANSAAAAATGAGAPFVDSSATTTSSFIVKAGTTALTNSTAYVWYYKAVG